MIDIKSQAGIAVLTLTHGKANALDIELCEALAARFMELRGSDAKAVVVTGQGKIFLRRRRSHPAERRRRRLTSANSCPSCTSSTTRCSTIPSRWWRRSTATPLPAAACSPVAPTGASWRATGGRIGVTELLVGVPFPALAFEIVRFAVPPRYLPEFTLSGATYATDVALQRGWIDEVAEPGELIEDAIAVAQELALLSPAAFAQTKMQIRQAVTERMAQSGAGDRQGGHRDLDRAGDAGLYPRLRRAHAQEKLITPPLGPARGRR